MSSKNLEEIGEWYDKNTITWYDKINTDGSSFDATQRFELFAAIDCRIYAHMAKIVGTLLGWDDQLI